MLVSYLAVMLPLGVLFVLANITEPSQIAVGLAITLGLAVLYWALGLVEASLAHVVLYLFGARGLAKTFDAYAFPIVVRNGLWWIPLVNLLLGFYGLYLQIKGLAAFHDISTGKAAIAAILAPLLIFVPATVVIAAVIAAFVLDMGEPPTQPAMLALELVV